MIGKSMLTYEGLKALIQAQTSGTPVKPTHFKFSATAYGEDAQLTDITGWIQRDISGYVPVNDDTVEFLCDVPVELASQYTRTAGLYLESGKLFLLAWPPYPFPPGLRQKFRVQARYGNIQALLSYQYIPSDDLEQQITLLDTQAVLGDRMISNTNHISLLRGAFKGR